MARLGLPRCGSRLVQASCLATNFFACMRYIYIYIEREREREGERKRQRELMAYSTLGCQIMSNLKVSGLTEDSEIPPRSKLKQTHALTARAWLGPPLCLRESMAQAFAATGPCPACVWRRRVQPRVTLPTCRESEPQTEMELGETQVVAVSSRQRRHCLRGPHEHPTWQ